MDEQNQSLRTNIALVLIILMTVGFMWWSGGFNPAKNEAEADGGAAVAVVKDAGSNPVQVVMNTTGVSDGGQVEVTDGGAMAQAGEPPPPTLKIERDRSTARYEFWSEGGGLSSAELKGKKMREQVRLSIPEGYRKLFGGEYRQPPQMNLAQPVPGSTLPLGVTVVSGNGSIIVPGDAKYAVLDQGGASDTKLDTKLTMRAKQSGIEITKKLEWQQDGYELRYTLELKNTGGLPFTGEYSVEYVRAIDPEHEEAPSMFAGVGNQSRAACYEGDTFHKELPKGDIKVEEFKGPINFVAIDQQNFVSAIFPMNGAKQGRCVLAASATVRRSAAYFPVTIQPGETVTDVYGVYLGPKDLDLLTAAPSMGTGTDSATAAAPFHPTLEKTVDYGIWAVLCKVLLAILKFWHGVFGNWGVAIIMLTVLVKIVLIPLTHKSMVAAENMKKLQPKMDEIRKKYAEDKERQNQEMMKLYQEQKVNPFGGCLPMLLQMPIWIALFTTLRNSFEIYQEPFVVPFITDLTFKDPTYLMPLLLGVTMIVTQRLQPQMMDAQQAKIMTWVMPIFFTAIMLNYPAGLTLYIFTNNVLSIVQQWGLKRYIARKSVPAKA
ncbi:MAG: membrane protein insertase YidC [Myxococcaceae bacterium]